MTAAAPPAVLIADPDPAHAAEIERALAPDFTVHRARTADAALRILEDEYIQILFCDRTLPDSDGVDLLVAVRERWPEVMRIMLTESADSRACEMIKAVNDAGVYQYIAKPWRAEALMLTARNAARLHALQREHERLSVEMKLLAPSMQSRLERQRERLRRTYSFDGVVRAPGSPMHAVVELAAQIATFDVPALLLGETGTGKELLARAIHYSSLRSDRPFFAVNCGAIPDELLESELFGHRKGAFTGAHAHREGLLEQADGGTVFLDEIGEISPAFQVKMLRFLQEGEIRPVGANATRMVDVRIIAATNRDLQADAASGAFRLDLYYRLAVAPIRIPPLRERPADVGLLAHALLARAAARHGKCVRRFSPEAMERLRAHSWPGNIRELENEVTRMLILAQSDVLGAETISPAILRAAPVEAAEDAAADDALSGVGPLKERVERMEQRILRETLIRHRWNKSRAADELGLSRVGLRSKLERYGMEAPASNGAANGVVNGAANGVHHGDSL